MSRYFKSLPIAFIILGILLPCATAVNAQATRTVADRIGVIDESSLVSLKGNHHPLAIPANDRGEVAPDLPMERMLLVLKRDAAAESSLEQLLAEQQDKLSQRFHAWFSPEQFGGQFGPSRADLQKLHAWLESHGFRVNRVAHGGMAIEFSGTASQVKEAFHTAIHLYAVNGANHFANASDPQIPVALTTVVAGVDTLHSFQKPPSIRVLGPAARIGNTSTWQPEFTFNGFFGAEHFLAPGDFAQIYNTASLYKSGIDGTGQSIAIVGRTNINLSDLQIFRIAFGLPANNPQIILDGPDPGNFFGPEEAEADLDIEWSGAVAPKATINFVVSASTNATDGADLSAQYIVDNNLAPVLSSSFGECEQLLGQAENTFYNNLWEQAAAQGITVIVSSGDSGAAGCDAFTGSPASQGPAVNGIASTPFNIAVGGTQFNENGADSTYWSATNGPAQSSALGYIPEVVWNESCSDDPNLCPGFVTLFASSGGVSTIYSKPSWQAGAGVPNDGMRDLPDIAFAAGALHDGYLLCQDGTCLTDSTGQLINAEVVGGTSAGAPSFAGIMALVNQKTNSRQGQANFVLYPLAASQTAANCNASGPPQSQCLFDDITQGNNDVPGQSGVSAGPGYDMATGLGSVNAANLINSWKNVTFLGTSTNLHLSSTSFTHGQPVTATVTVTPATGTRTPSGDVALLPGIPQSLNLGTLTNGSVSAPVSALPGGSYSLTASYGGDGTFGASISPGVPVTVSPESSTTVFSPVEFGPHGNLVPVTSVGYSDFMYLQVAIAGASQQGSATGTITFSDTFNGSTATLMTVPLDVRGGALALETSLAVGNHTLNASYSGDASFTASAAAPVSLTVTKGATQTFLFAPSGALPNSSVILQALVFPQGNAAPSGTVQFMSNAQALGSPVALVDLIATLTTTQLPAGSSAITAVYSGDGNFNGSTSQAVTVFVGIPDFQLAVNPGNVTVSASVPGKSTILLSPGPGLGFFGTVSFTCAGLPTGVSCSFQPSQLNLDGFTTMTTVLAISKTGQAAIHAQVDKRSFMLAGSLGGLIAVCALLVWPPRKRHCHFKAGGLLIFVCLLGAGIGWASGCGGGSNTNANPPPPATNSFVVTVTAAGGSGAQAVSHTATLAVTVQ